MNVLVTGGAGFIGSYLVDKLIMNGHEVAVLDDLSAGNLGNLRQHMGKSGFSFIEGDIRDSKTTERSTTDVDAIVHEAAITGVPRSLKNPELTMDVNVSGTLNLLKAGLEHDIKRFVFASSCAVYGEAGKEPIAEGTRPRPSAPYASTKLSGEASCQKFFDEGLDTVCLRYFNVLRSPAKERRVCLLLNFWIGSRMFRGPSFTGMANRREISSTPMTSPRQRFLPSKKRKQSVR